MPMPPPPPPAAAALSGDHHHHHHHQPDDDNHHPGGSPGGPGRALAPAQAARLLASFAHFLTVALHNVLYYRGLYPAATFLTSRAYNLPVHQSRHPRVCAWVRDAVDAVRAQLARGAARRVAVVIHQQQHQQHHSSGGGIGGGGEEAGQGDGRGGGGARVLERWVFDVAGFPAFGGSDGGDHWTRDGGGEEVDDDEGESGEAAAHGGSGGSKINWVDVDEQLRAAVRRLAYVGEKMAPLPSGCTFTVAVELRDAAEAPIGHPQPWVPSQPNLQPASRDRPAAGEDLGGARTTPLRAVEAGPLFFECWVEEGKAKTGPTSTSSSSHE
ncbi:HORMA domain-containing protein [Xylariaceae sp. FL0804]|nr:HORMA domain-containing protein [Xylariaceae sp. FL0804]